MTLGSFCYSSNPKAQSLHSIDTGIIAAESVNMDKAVGCGRKILDGNIGHGVLEYVFKKKNKLRPFKQRL